MKTIDTFTPPKAAGIAVLLSAVNPKNLILAAKLIGDAISALARRCHIKLLIARDIGQVRDVLSRVVDDPAITRFYPTIQAAVTAAQRKT